MKHLLSLLLVAMLPVIGFSQINTKKPNTFTEETDPNNSNFEFYSQYGDSSRRASFQNVRKNMVLDVNRASLTTAPDTTGNASNLMSFIHTETSGTTDSIYVVDADGESFLLYDRKLNIESLTLSGDTLFMTKTNASNDTIVLTSVDNQDIDTLYLSGSTLYIQLDGGTLASVSLSGIAGIGSLTANNGVGIQGDTIIRLESDTLTSDVTFYTQLGGGRFRLQPLSGSNSLNLTSDSTKIQIGSNRAYFTFLDTALLVNIALNGEFTITDSRSTTSGLEYAADYSAGFTDRTLVDKEYVDDQIAANPGTWYVQQGSLIDAVSGDTILFVGAGTVSVALDTTNNTITFTGTGGGSGVGEANVGANLGDGTDVYFGKADTTLQFKSLKVGGINAITSTDTTITITATEVDGSITNELQTVDSLILSGSTLILTLENDGEAPYTLDLSSVNTDNQTVDTLSFSGGIITLAIEGDGEAPYTVDISAVNTDNQTVDTLSYSGGVITLALEGDGEAPYTVDISAVDTDTDNQTVDTLSLTGTVLTLALEGDGEAPYTVDLAGLQDGTGTDDQAISIDSSGQYFTITLEDGGSVIFDNNDGDADATNEAWTIDADDADTEVIANQTVKFEGAGTVTTDYNPATNTLVITGAGGGSGTGEANVGANLGDGEGVYASKADTTLQFKSIIGAGINVVTSTDTTIVVTATEVDGSVTNEIQTVDTLSLSGTVLTLALEGDGEAPYTVDLSGLQDGTGTDNQTVDTLSYSGGVITLALEGDGEAPYTVDISAVDTDTDNQTVDTLSLSGTVLTLALEDDGEAPYTVDLSGLQDGTGTDDQTVDTLSYSGGVITLALEGDGEAPYTVDISAVNTDNQTVDTFSLSGNTLTLALEGDGEAPYTVDLSSISGTASGRSITILTIGNSIGVNATDTTNTTGVHRFSKRAFAYDYRRDSLGWLVEDTTFNGGAPLNAPPQTIGQPDGNGIDRVGRNTTYTNQFIWEYLDKHPIDTVYLIVTGRGAKSLTDSLLANTYYRDSILAHIAEATAADAYHYSRFDYVFLGGYPGENSGLENAVLAFKDAMDGEGLTDDGTTWFMNDAPFSYTADKWNSFMRQIVNRYDQFVTAYGYEADSLATFDGVHPTVGKMQEYGKSIYKALIEGRGYGEYARKQWKIRTRQELTAAEDNYVLTYDFATNEASFEVASSGGMSSFTLAGDSGSSQTISNGNTLDVEGGRLVATTAGATDKVTIDVVHGLADGDIPYYESTGDSLVASGLRSDVDTLKFSGNVVEVQFNNTGNVIFSDNTNDVSFENAGKINVPGLTADNASTTLMAVTGDSIVTRTVSSLGIITDHGGQTGLTDDDHTQYALLAGRAGGQSLTGGTNAGQHLTLSSTSNATKGQVQILDNEFTLLDNSVPSKELRFQLSGITASNTRTLTVPDTSGTITLRNSLTAGSIPSWGGGGQFLVDSRLSQNTDGTVLFNDTTGVSKGRLLFGSNNGVGSLSLRNSAGTQTFLEIRNGGITGDNYIQSYPASLDLIFMVTDSNVLQLNHTNFDIMFNQYRTNTFVGTTAGLTGMTGFTANGTVKRVEFEDLTAETSPVSGDKFILYDSSGTSYKHINFSTLNTLWAGGGGGTPGGSNTQLQYNNGGSFGGTASLTYASATGLITYNPTLDEATGDEIGLNITPTVNKATSGNYTALKVNVTETAAPGAGDLLLDLQVGGTSQISVDNGGVVTFKDGVRQTFNPDGTNSGVNVGSHTADPSSGSNGDIFYNSTSNKFRAYQNGAWTDVIGGGGGMSSFDLAADSGTAETVSDGETIDIAGGNGVSTAVAATNTVTVNALSYTEQTGIAADSILETAAYQEVWRDTINYFTTNEREGYEATIFLHWNNATGADFIDFQMTVDDESSTTAFSTDDDLRLSAGDDEVIPIVVKAMPGHDGNQVVVTYAATNENGVSSMGKVVSVDDKTGNIILILSVRGATTGTDYFEVENWWAERKTR